jgi:type IV pilus assembly protein PilP
VTRLHPLPNLALAAAACSLLLGLAGCGDRMGDLRQYTNEVKARKGGRIEPLPQIKPFEVYTYSDQDQRSPFVPQMQTAALANVNHGTSTTSLHPDFNRSHEYLEQFPLDGLKMVGTLTLNGSPARSSASPIQTSNCRRSSRTAKAAGRSASPT